MLGVYLCCNAFAPGMIERGGGRIVNIASGAAYLPPRARPADRVRREQGRRPPLLRAARRRPRAEERVRLLDQPRPRADGDDEALPDRRAVDAAGGAPAARARARVAANSTRSPAATCTPSTIRPRNCAAASTRSSKAGPERDPAAPLAQGTMGAMRLALAQINPIVGDLAGNRALILDAARGGEARGADLVLFPELAVTGYPPEDLLLRPRLRPCGRGVARGDRRAARGIVAVVGSPYFDRDLYNAAAVCAGGEVKALVEEAFPAELRRLRRVPLFRAGRRARPLRARRRRSSA